MSFSIRTKLILLIVFTLGAAGAASGVLVRDLYLRSARSAAEQALRNAAAAYEQLERNDVEKLSTVLDVLVHHPGLREAFAARDREKLQSIALPMHQTLKGDHGINHWNFIEPETRRMFLRPHLPNKYGDVIERQSLIKAMSRLETSAGKELGKSEFALRVGRPFTADGRVIGYIELGEGITHFLGKMKAQTNDEFAMFIHKNLIDRSEWARTRGNRRNSWNDFTDVVVVNSTTNEPIVDTGAIEAHAAQEGSVLEEMDEGGAVFVRGVFPVRNSAGTVVGGLVVRHDITPLMASMRQGGLQALAFLVALTLAAAVLVYLLAERLIFRRLQRMASSLEDLSTRLAGGDYTVAAPAPESRTDEIGRFETFFGRFLGMMATTLRDSAERNKQLARTAPARPAGPQIR